MNWDLVVSFVVGGIANLLVGAFFYRRASRDLQNKIEDLQGRTDDLKNATDDLKNTTKALVLMHEQTNEGISTAVRDEQGKFTGGTSTSRSAPATMAVSVALPPTVIVDDETP